MSNDLLDWFIARYPDGYMFEEYVPLAKLEEKLYEMFCKHTGSLFSKKFLRILLQSTRRKNADPSIQYLMDTEDWYEALNAFDAKDELMLHALAYKHFESTLKKELRKQRHAAKYITDGETVWELTL